MEITSPKPMIPAVSPGQGNPNTETEKVDQQRSNLTILNRTSPTRTAPPAGLAGVRGTPQIQAQGFHPTPEALEATELQLATAASAAQASSDAWAGCCDLPKVIVFGRKVLNVASNPKEVSPEALEALYQQGAALLKTLEQSKYPSIAETLKKLIATLQEIKNEASKASLAVTQAEMETVRKQAATMIDSAKKNHEAAIKEAWKTMVIGGVTAAVGLAGMAGSALFLGVGALSGGVTAKKGERFSGLVAGGSTGLQVASGLNNSFASFANGSAQMLGGGLDISSANDRFAAQLKDAFIKTLDAEVKGLEEQRRTWEAINQSALDTQKQIQQLRQTLIQQQAQVMRAVNT